MAITIDQLNIELTADSQKASSAIDQLAKNLERLKTSLGPLANVNVKVSNSFSTQTKNINKASTAMQNYTNKSNQAGKSSQSLAQKLAQKISTTRTLVSVFQNMANTMADWFNESNEYIETLNLFNVTMGEGAEEARNFAESVSALMGIDPKEWMQYQGIFKNLTAGFGVASDKANVMSKNLTQLSYDLSSFFNTDVETAFDKLSSAMSGQVKGLREFGIDTTVASLQEYALSKGIDASVRSMSQAEKSLLRYNYIMEKSIIMQGDMARTIITPANSLRILNAQFTQMKRALGNIISVVVTQFIPYVQALVQVITEAALAIAKFFNFSTEDFEANTKGLATDAWGIDEAEEGLDGTSDKLKKIKKQLMGFDELNIINNPESDSTSGGVGSGGAGLNLEPLEYNFLEGLDTSKVDEIKATMEEVLKIVGIIGTAIASWKLSKSFMDGINALTNLITLNPKQAIVLGAILTITGFTLEFSGIKSAIENGLNGLNFTEILVGGLLGSGGAAILGGGLAVLIDKAFGSSGVALAITKAGINLGTSTMAGTGAALAAGVGGIVAGIPMYFTGIYDAIKNGLNWMNGLLIPLGSTMAGAGIGVIIGSLGGPIGAGLGALIGLCVGALTDIGILIYEKWDEIKAYFAPFFEWFNTNLIQPVKDKLSKVSEWFNTNVIQPVVAFFQPIKDAFQEVKTYAVEKFTEIKDGIVERVTIIWNKIVEIKNKIVEIFSALWWAFQEYVWKPIVDKVTTFYNEKIKPIVDKVKAAFTEIWNNFKTAVVDKIKAKFDEFKTKLTEIRDNAIAVFKKVGTSVVDFISGQFKGVINGVLSTIESNINRFIRLLNSAINIINKIPGVNISRVSEIYIPRLAEGGIVENVGQLFIARERGPELVGSIGRKTAVANNDQIIGGIESGVYRAMMAANSTKQGGTQTIRIINEIDGDFVGEKVIEYHNNRVMQTGSSPLLV